MKKRLDASPLILPMPALLVGTWSPDGTANAMTAAWTGACCHEPPCVGVAVRGNRLTHRNIEARRAFTLNVPSAALAAQVDAMGLVSGADRPDKLALAGLETAPGCAVDAPLVVVCPVNLECRLVESVRLGTHTWFVGEVARVHADEHVLDEAGRIDPAALDPLVYCASSREYRRLGERLGGAFEMGRWPKEKP